VEELEKAASRGRPYSLILLDAETGGVEGSGIAESIKCDPRFNEAKVVILTSVGLCGDVSKCHAIGLSSCMIKPIKGPALRETIIALLGRGEGARYQSRATAIPRCESGGVLTILLAEDNEVNQVMATLLLETKGHIVVLAETGRQALEAMEQRTFDLILMDVQMPEMDGLEATRAIRQREKGSGRHVPIIAVTANAMTGDREQCLQAGMDDYVAKPLAGKTLFDVIEGLMAQQVVTPPAAKQPGRILTDTALASSVGLHNTLRSIGEIETILALSGKRAS
jgi:CheY-like chemotaxis protein